MQAFCALADSQPAQQGNAPAQLAKHAQHSAEPAAQAAVASMSCQSIVQAMASRGGRAAIQSQGAALKRKVAMVGLPWGTASAMPACCQSAKACTFGMLHTSLHIQWPGFPIAASHRASMIQGGSGI